MMHSNSYSDAGLARLPAVRRLIALAIDEDMGRGDVTTTATITDRDAKCLAEIRARESLVVFGVDVAAAVFHTVDPRVSVRRLVENGETAAAGRAVLEINGPTQAILQAERTALNFLQRLSGVASMARRFADAVAGTGARVVDTRKTTPGYRVLEKAAVMAGGCFNHRFDLGSGVLIKDNHVAACGGVGVAIARAQANAPHALRVEVEVDTLKQLAEALEAGAEVVLLDNMTPEQVGKAVEMAHACGVLVEVSGGVSLGSVREYAEMGADIISVGAMTHSAPAVDLGLDFVADEAGETP